MKSLALLKEETVEFVLGYKDSVVAKIWFDDVLSSVRKELLSAMARGGEKMGTDNAGEATVTYWNMGVNSLRRDLHKRGRWTLMVQGWR